MQEAASVESGAMLASSFELAGSLCALDTDSVEEVVRLRRITRVPHAPAYVVGILNLRGKIVTVIDLARKMGLGAAAVDDDSRLYIVRDQDALAGLLVDRAAEVIEIGEGSLEPRPANMGEAAARFIRGVARHGDRLAAVLDLEAVLSTSE
jgi:purine-binding chemotaxis protein CheW